MKVTLSSGNRVTIPKVVMEELNLSLGQSLELEIRDGVITINPQINSTEDNIKQIESQIPETKENKPIKEHKLIERPKNYKTLTVNGIKIESNLEEGSKFSRKIYSDCGLVIRTKRNYLDKFCEACQGELAYQNGVLDHPCKYINIPERVEIEEPKKENPVKSIVKKLTDNISKLDKKLDNKIDTIEQEFP